MWYSTKMFYLEPEKLNDDEGVSEGRIKVCGLWCNFQVLLSRREISLFAELFLVRRVEVFSLLFSGKCRVIAKVDACE